MIISRREADERRNSPSNPFLDVDSTPTSLPVSSPTPRQDTFDSFDKDDDVSDDDSSDSSGDGPSDETIKEIRSLLAKGDPGISRDRRKNLKGQTDIQAAIGQTAMIIGDKSAGHIYDRSAAQVEAYRHGNSEYDQTVGKNKKEPKPELAWRLDEFKVKLAEIAARRLESSLVSMSDTKLESVKRPTNLARIARDMATVVEKMSDGTGKKEAIHFHLYRPQIKDIGGYETVSVGVGEFSGARSSNAPEALDAVVVDSSASANSKA